MITSNQQVLDLGVLHFGRTYKFKFHLKNEYSHPIKIDKAYGGCSACTTVHIEKTNIESGESFDVNVSFTPGSTGMQSKNVYISYSHNLVPFPDLQLKFKGMVDG